MKSARASRRADGVGARASRLILRWPSRNYFAELQPHTKELHPIDHLIDSAPDIRRVARRARRLLARIQRRAGADVVLAFEAERNAAEWARVETAYNLGVEGGLVLGRAERLRREHSHRRRGYAERQLLRELCAALTETRASPREIGALLLELAYALVVGPGKTELNRSRRA